MGYQQASRKQSLKRRPLGSTRIHVALRPHAAMHTYSTHTPQQYTYVQQCTRCNTFRPLPSPSVITDAQHAVVRSSRAHADLQVALVAERADAAHRLCGRGMHE